MNDDIRSLLHSSPAEPSGPLPMAAIRRRARGRQSRRWAGGTLALLLVGLASAAALSTLGTGPVELAPGESPATTQPDTRDTTEDPAGRASEPPDAAATPACPEAAGPGTPSEASHARTFSADVTGDGLDDDLWISVVDGGGTFLYVSFATAGSERTLIEASTTGAAEILGTSPTASQGHLVWLNLGTGASAPLVGVAVVHGCTVRQVVTEDGEPLQMWTGGSVRSRASIDCRDGRITTYWYDLAWDEDAARPLLDEPGNLTVHRYHLDGRVAVLVETVEQKRVPFDEAVAGVHCDPVE